MCVCERDIEREEMRGKEGEKKLLGRKTKFQKDKNVFNIRKP